MSDTSLRLSDCTMRTIQGLHQELVRQLRAIGIPLLVFVVTEAGAAETLDPGPLTEDPECFHALEVGKIAEGLAKL